MLFLSFYFYIFISTSPLRCVDEKAGEDEGGSSSTGQILGIVSATTGVIVSVVGLIAVLQLRRSDEDDASVAEFEPMEVPAELVEPTEAEKDAKEGAEIETGCGAWNGGCRKRTFSAG